MPMLVNCSNCRTPLQLPAGATVIRCALCQAITHIVIPCNMLPTPAPPPLPPPFSTLPLFNVPPPPFLYNRMPPGPPLNAHGRKKAVIVGISYRYSRHELKGCINDAKCMRYLLINKFHFPQESILMLTEEEIDPYRIPTKYNIRMALNWLVQGCQPGDSLLFHYSGHGSRQRNSRGNEVDGYDETLCPLDFETQGMIVDNDINATIVRPLPLGVKLHAIIDAGHSGTVLDLPFLCRMNRAGQYIWEDHRPRSGIWKGTSGGEVISFSSCEDDQTSAESSALSKITSTGAMTYCFIQAIESGHATTYGSVLNSMRTAIRGTGRNDLGVGGGVVTSLLNTLLIGGSVGGGLRQEPQLTACQPFDVYTKPFSL
ncbi:hypothetical protein CMV_018615 [Castanea mollissima]|uniref:Metacaspase-1 n=1 Tax=Castanea mollissima TaxID=60419 RepID=A0A8J4QP91_9ROSI|nr:hypothetical protein CMV_018615 [Castanea mollissima]